jgi:hypothetical protein
LKRAEERVAGGRDGFYAVSALRPSAVARGGRAEHRRRTLLPTRRAEGLAGAPPEHLADIEISPAGLGPGSRLDADLYVPALLPRVFRSKSWMARVLGAQGGRARAVARVAASRENGRKGGAEEGRA